MKGETVHGARLVTSTVVDVLAGTLWSDEKSVRAQLAETQFQNRPIDVILVSAYSIRLKA